MVPAPLQWVEDEEGIVTVLGKDSNTIIFGTGGYCEKCHI